MTNGTPRNERPIYWNMLGFALIGAAFSAFAMCQVAEEFRSEIAVLYLGLIGGYAAAIKELDLARIKIERLLIERNGIHPVNPETTENENPNSQGE